MVSRRPDESRTASARQAWIPRVLAPLAFFAAATILVLLVNSSLNADTNADDTAPVTAAQPGTGQAGTGNEPTTTRQRQRRRFHRIQEGDTLEALAARYNTTVDELLQLNPGINANSLAPGQRVRVN